MVRIRFRRVGLKGQPSYRIVVIDGRKSRNGGFLEIIGHHNPRTQPEVNVVKEDRALYWLSVGAQPSDGVRRILEKNGTMERLKRFHQGEPMANLVAEVMAQAPANPVPFNLKTSYPAPSAGESHIKAREAARSKE